ncbi:MAG TPA: 4Fe-4S dicluster domain-containing protein, partial [Planctomycetota bacterium]|nr:4Fe-4S dicluster domain-containing protein [Planctomycetota bacterium]
MQLGFVIDHSRCIGCHACTVACKSENDVPVGDFRTWVKYTEEGAFPAVKRHFTVLRCNQCSAAPCVTICPTGALKKRADGIVDVDPKACIGCKGCMQACPYDALYLNASKGTAEKCHFCAHRTERGLAPACVVVCPTEALVPGDFDDPTSRVSRMKATGELAARRTEVGTGPNVWYR